MEEMENSVPDGRDILKILDQRLFPSLLVTFANFATYESKTGNTQ